METLTASVAGASRTAVRRATRAAVALTGFTAVTAQVVLLRELMVVFQGNEIALGLMLASWLLWTAAGSSLASRVAADTRSPARLTGGLQVALGLALPATLLAIRSSKLAFQPLPGEVPGPGVMLLTALATLSLFCLVSGGLFAAGSRLYATEAEASPGRAISSVYLLEAGGSAAGGLLTSLALIRYLTPFQVAALLGWLNLLAAVALAIRKPLVRRACWGLLVLALPLLLLGGNLLEGTSLRTLWRGFHLAATRNSIYGNLAVVDTGGARSLYENGGVVFTVPDPAAAEEAVHFALLEHPRPRSLLLIGGGLNGSLAQAFQHPSLEQADYVELDPAVLDLAAKHFPAEWAAVKLDRRIRIHHMDGRLFVKSRSGRYDVVIVNLPDPQTAQLNRFYTLEFFREIAAILRPGGVFAIQLRGAENYISPELGEFLRSNQRTLLEAFAETSAIPGDTVHFFASRERGVLTSDPQELLRRLGERQLKTAYVREYYVPFRMMPDRMQELAEQIRPRPETPVNRDFAPVAYYFNVSLWSAQYHDAYRIWFQHLARVSFARATATAAVTMAVLGLVVLGWRKRRHALAGLSVATMGMTLMALQVLLLLGFQALYGYVYHALAILIALFMAGLAVGSWWALRSAKGTVRGSGAADLRRLGVVQVLAAAAPLLLFAVLQGLAQVHNNTGIALVSHAVLPGMALLSGVLGGYQFPTASRVFFAEGEPRSLGALYALDLVGACVGAVLVSAYLIPVFGFLRTAILLALVNVVPALLVAGTRREAALS